MSLICCCWTDSSPLMMLAVSRTADEAADADRADAAVRGPGGGRAGCGTCWLCWTRPPGWTYRSRPRGWTCLSRSRQKRWSSRRTSFVMMRVLTDSTRRIVATRIVGPAGKDRPSRRSRRGRTAHRRVDLRPRASGTFDLEPGTRPGPDRERGNLFRTGLTCRLSLFRRRPRCRAASAVSSVASPAAGLTASGEVAGRAATSNSRSEEPWCRPARGSDPSRNSRFRRRNRCRG